MGRKWCPGTAEFNYVYRSGHLYPVLDHQKEPLGLDVGTGEFQPEPVTPVLGTAEERLAEVTRLHDVGVLTDQEYEAKRAEIISEL